MQTWAQVAASTGEVPVALPMEATGFDPSLKRSISETCVEGQQVIGRETCGEKRTKGSVRPRWAYRDCNKLLIEQYADLHGLDHTVVMEELPELSDSDGHVDTELTASESGDGESLGLSDAEGSTGSDY